MSDFSTRPASSVLDWCDFQLQCLHDVRDAPDRLLLLLLLPLLLPLPLLWFVDFRCPLPWTKFTTVDIVFPFSLVPCNNTSLTQSPNLISPPFRTFCQTISLHLPCPFYETIPDILVQRCKFTFQSQWLYTSVPFWNRIISSFRCDIKI